MTEEQVIELQKALRIKQLGREMDNLSLNTEEFRALQNPQVTPAQVPNSDMSIDQQTDSAST